MVQFAVWVCGYPRTRDVRHTNQACLFTWHCAQRSFKGSGRNNTDKRGLLFSTEHTYAEDVEIANTFRRMKPPIIAEEIADHTGRAQFLPLGLGIEHILFRNDSNANVQGWWKYCSSAKEGLDCCSSHWIATHYITPHEMRYIHSASRQQCNPPRHTWPFAAFV